MAKSIVRAKAPAKVSELILNEGKNQYRLISMKNHFILLLEVALIAAMHYIKYSRENKPLEMPVKGTKIIRQQQLKNGLKRRDSTLNQGVFVPEKIRVSSNNNIPFYESNGFAVDAAGFFHRFSTAYNKSGFTIFSQREYPTDPAQYRPYQ
jgi:hypothetical protein